MWRLAGNIATWHHDHLQGNISLLHPEQGFRGVVFQGHELHDASLHQIQLVEQSVRDAIVLADCYTRGNDLIATYDDAGGQIRAQVYWRISPGHGLREGTLIIESLVSTQTDLLDSNPNVDVRCHLPAASCEVFQALDSPPDVVFPATEAVVSTAINCGPGGGAVAFRLTDSPVVFVQLFQASDVVRAELTRGLH